TSQGPCVAHSFGILGSVFLEDLLDPTPILLTKSDRRRRARVVIDRAEHLHRRLERPQRSRAVPHGLAGPDRDDPEELPETLLLRTRALHVPAAGELHQVDVATRVDVSEPGYQAVGAGEDGPVRIDLRTCQDAAPVEVPPLATAEQTRDIRAVPRGVLHPLERASTA